MNAKRRVVLERVKEDLVDVMNQEQDVLDNMPENLQASERADKISEGIDYLQEAIDALDSIVSL